MSGEKRASSASTFHILQSEFANPEYGLRQFRSDVAKLKKLGLVSKHVSARSQEPTRYMIGQVRKFADVIKGEARAIKIPKIELPSYKGGGFRTKGSRAVIPAPKGATVKRAKPKNGIPSYSISIPSTDKKKGVTIERHLFPANTLRAKLRDWIAHLKPLRKGEYFAFRYRGYMSARIFSGPDAREEMIEYMERYIPDELDTEESEEYFEAFEVVRIEDTKAWAKGYQRQQEQSAEHRRTRNRDRLNAWRRKKYAEMDELERREKFAKNNKAKAYDKNYHKKKRDELKRTDPEAYRAMLDRNAERMRKSRANRKKS